MPRRAAPVPQAGGARAHQPAMTGPRILIATSMGDITLQLDSVRAPKTVADILRYVKDKHYDGTVFYRVRQGLRDPDGKLGRQGQGRAASIRARCRWRPRMALSNLRGTVGLARGEEPDSAGADFFINVGDNIAAGPQAKDDPGNTTGYAVFGKVIGGMDVVDAIGNVPVGDNGPMPGQAPVTPIVDEESDDC